MSLPDAFKTAEEYFKEAVHFLDHYQWIFRSSNTQFIINGTIKDIPTEWIDCFLEMSLEEINSLPFGVINEKYADSLKTFLTTSQRLSPKYRDQNNLEPIAIKPMKGVSPKKMHEIVNLTDKIHSVCDGKVSSLIDLGSGLGYLSQTLHQKHNYNVVGFEAEPDRVEAAIKRQSTYFPNSITSVKYYHHFVTENSSQCMQQHLSNHTKFGIVGLHACADLTITAINLFLNTTAATNLIIMPCCYHKLSQNDDGSFQNIPLSKAFGDAVEKCDGFKPVLNRPFLRLACQQTAARWKTQSVEDHAKHGQEMFVRASVELLVAKESEAVVVRKGCQFRNTENLNLIDAIFDKFQLTDQRTREYISWNENHYHKLQICLHDNPNGSVIAELLTGLQANLQSISENIVLLDRVHYIKEQSEILSIQLDVFVEKIVNDAMSPRCFALICEKKSNK